MINVRDARYDENGNVLCQYSIDGDSWIHAWVSDQSVAAEVRAYEIALSEYTAQLRAQSIDKDNPEEWVNERLSEWKYDGVMACSRIKEILHTVDIAPFVPPENWKHDAQVNVRAVRDQILKGMTDPDETETGRMIWNPKLLSALVVLIGVDKVAAMIGLSDMPPEIQAAFSQITSSMSAVAAQNGMTVEQYSMLVVGKFFAYSALIWLAEEKTGEAWKMIEDLPDTAESYHAVKAKEVELSKYTPEEIITAEL